MIRKAIGLLMLSTPFIAIIILVIIKTGMLATIMILSSVTVFVALMYFGMELLLND